MERTRNSLGHPSTLYKTLRLVPAAALCITALLFASSNSQQGVPQTPNPSPEKAAAYFPTGVFDLLAFYISDFLSRADEPSLLAAAQNPNSLSYRFDLMSFYPTGQMLAVRLSLNPDGSARITMAKESLTTHVLQKAEGSVSAADVHKFLRRLEKADFWSMPTMEPENKDDSGRRAYKVDAHTWIFEGVRNGSYHVVQRRGPESSPFTEMVLFLTNDLAGLDVQASPRASPAP